MSDKENVEEVEEVEETKLIDPAGKIVIGIGAWKERLSSRKLWSALAFAGGNLTGFTAGMLAASNMAKESDNSDEPDWMSNDPADQIESD